MFKDVCKKHFVKNTREYVMHSSSRQYLSIAGCEHTKKQDQRNKTKLLQMRKIEDQK